MSQAESRAQSLYDKHEASLRAAGRACRERGYFSLFPETPDRHRGGTAASGAGADILRSAEIAGRAVERVTDFAGFRAHARILHCCFAPEAPEHLLAVPVALSVTAGEARDPQRAVPRAMRSMVGRLDW